MNIIINGDERSVANSASVQQLLEELGLPAESTVVERNGEIVMRDRFGETMLADGDRLEIVRFVGGG